MKFLIIDTSTERGLIAISDGLKILFNHLLPVGLQSSKYALPAIESALETLNLTFEDFSAVAATIGPGSFTGIRVGAALAKGIAFGASLPLISLSSLEGFITHEEGCFASIIDARIGGAYVLLRERCQGKIINLEEPKLIPAKELARYLSNARHSIGPSFERLFLPNAIECAPDAEYLAETVYHKWVNHEWKHDLEEIVYLREMKFA